MANTEQDRSRPTALHHVTAISADAQANYDFYAGVLGLRFVKKTVNFDDPSTYHLYYGDRIGAPGTAITFFPWSRLPQGRVGLGQTSLTSYSAPVGSLDFWEERLAEAGARLLAREEVFGEQRVIALDPDGAPIAIVEAAEDPRADGDRLWTGGGVDAAHALRGFHGVTLALAEEAPTATILTEIFGYVRQGEAPGPGGVGRMVRFKGADAAGVVDLHVAPELKRGLDGAGTVHHIAFSVPDRAAQVEVQNRVSAAGLHVTPQIDRDYFWAIYFRTPGGVLFEVATDEPGFATDESVEHLGEGLMLPKRHEPLRDRIEEVLPPLRTAKLAEAAR